MAKNILSMGIMAWALWAQSGMAQDIPAETIKSATIIDVPFVIDEVDVSHAQTTLWAKGDEPANSLLASITIRPASSEEPNNGGKKGG